MSKTDSDSKSSKIPINSDFIDEDTSLVQDEDGVSEEVYELQLREYVKLVQEIEARQEHIDLSQDLNLTITRTPSYGNTSLEMCLVLSRLCDMLTRFGRKEKTLALWNHVLSIEKHLYDRKIAELAEEEIQQTSKKKKSTKTSAQQERAITESKTEEDQYESCDDNENDLNQISNNDSKTQRNRSQSPALVSPTKKHSVAEPVSTVEHPLKKKTKPKSKNSDVNSNSVSKESESDYKSEQDQDQDSQQLKSDRDYEKERKKITQNYEAKRNRIKKEIISLLGLSHLTATSSQGSNKTISQDSDSLKRTNSDTVPEKPNLTTSLKSSEEAASGSGSQSQQQVQQQSGPGFTQDDSQIGRSRVFTDMIESHSGVVDTVASTTGVVSSILLSATASTARCGLLTVADTSYNISALALDYAIPATIGNGGSQLGRTLITGGFRSAYTISRTSVDYGLSIGTTVLSHLPVDSMVRGSVRLGFTMGAAVGDFVHGTILGQTSDSTIVEEESENQQKSSDSTLKSNINSSDEILASYLQAQNVNPSAVVSSIREENRVRRKVSEAKNGKKNVNNKVVPESLSSQPESPNLQSEQDSSNSLNPSNINPMVQTPKNNIKSKSSRLSDLDLSTVGDVLEPYQDEHDKKIRLLHNKKRSFGGSGPSCQINSPSVSKSPHEGEEYKLKKLSREDDGKMGIVESSNSSSSDHDKDLGILEKDNQSKKSNISSGSNTQTRNTAEAQIIVSNNDVKNEQQVNDKSDSKFENAPIPYPTDGDDLGISDDKSEQSEIVKNSSSSQTYSNVVYNAAGGVLSSFYNNDNQIYPEPQSNISIEVEEEFYENDVADANLGDELEEDDNDNTNQYGTQQTVQSRSPSGFAAQIFSSASNATASLVTSFTPWSSSSKDVPGPVGDISDIVNQGPLNDHSESSAAAIGHVNRSSDIITSEAPKNDDHNQLESSPTELSSQCSNLLDEPEHQSTPVKNNNQKNYQDSDLGQSSSFQRNKRTINSLNSSTKYSQTVTTSNNLVANDPTPETHKRMIASQSTSQSLISTFTTAPMSFVGTVTNLFGSQSQSESQQVLDQNGNPTEAEFDSKQSTTSNNVQAQGDHAIKDLIHDIQIEQNRDVQNTIFKSEINQDRDTGQHHQYKDPLHTDITIHDESDHDPADPQNQQYNSYDNDYPGSANIDYVPLSDIQAETSLYNNILSVTTNPLEDILEGMSNGVTTVTNGVTSGVTTVTNGVTSGVTTVTNGVTNSALTVGNATLSAIEASKLVHDPILGTVPTGFHPLFPDDGTGHENNIDNDVPLGDDNSDAIFGSNIPLNDEGSPIMTMMSTSYSTGDNGNNLDIMGEGSPILENHENIDLSENRNNPPDK